MPADGSTPNNLVEDYNNLEPILPLEMINFHDSIT
jgi:hypothetical protein